MNKKITITIGIPAYNEESNIAYFLSSIFKQKVKHFTLERIFVISDGSTDHTNKIVANLARKNKKLLLIADGKRKGKAMRLNELFKLNKSNIFVMLDADLIFPNANILEEISKEFRKNRVGMVGLNLKPVDSEKLIGKIINHWEKIWYEIRKDVNKGDNIHNIRGGAFAVRKELLRNLKISKTLQQVGRYIYFFTNHNQLRFSFAKKAVVFYRAPDNLYDYISTLSRKDNQELYFFEKEFGKNIYKQYKIPGYKKFYVLLNAMIDNPILTLTSLVLVYFAKFKSNYANSLDKPGFWKTTTSTKKAIANIIF